MNNQQDDFHISAEFNPTPTTNNAVITSTDGVQTTGGHPSLDPMWVQPSSDHCPGTSFDLPLGLQTITSPIPTETIHYQPKKEQLEDSDALVPLPEHLWETMPDDITPIDPTPFLPSLQEDLVSIKTNPVPVSSNNSTEGLSITAPNLQKPHKPSPRKESCARTYHRQPQQKQNKIFSSS